MPHSFSTIWIHAVWATKDRQPLIKPTWESQLHSFLRNQLADLSCPVRIINGMPDHIHMLFLLNSQKSVSDVIKQVKGASSHWVNQQDFSEDKFAWQTGYAAYSVSDSVKEKVFHYSKTKKSTIGRFPFRRNMRKSSDEFKIRAETF